MRRVRSPESIDGVTGVTVRSGPDKSDDLTNLNRAQELE